MKRHGLYRQFNSRPDTDEERIAKAETTRLQQLELIRQGIVHGTLSESEAIDLRNWIENTTASKKGK